MDMCESQQTTGKEMSVIFDQSINTLSEPISCICETIVLNGHAVEVDYVDIRMIRKHRNRSGSSCSSAVLRGEPNSDSEFKCNESLSEEDNLVFNVPVIVPLDTEGQKLRIIVDNLFADGADDSPVMVWISLKGT